MQIGSIERNPIRSADWAELQVLYGGYGSFSFESIRTAVDTEGLLDEEPVEVSGMPGESSQSLVADTVREIQRRMEHGGKGYPFRIRQSRLELKPGAHRKTPYAFCLMVSDRDYYSKSDPAPSMFELVASEALQYYLRGCAFKFGTPRRSPFQKIKPALEELSRLTGDTLRPSFPIKNTDKDLGLDVVGWKDFIDGKTSKVLVYMQCATGEDWGGKRGDLDLGIAGTWDKIVEWTTPPVKAMAIPYIVPPGDEWTRATPGILLMDRLRIASLLPARALSIEGIDWSSWFRDRLDSVSKSDDT